MWQAEQAFVYLVVAQCRTVAKANDSLMLRIELAFLLLWMANDG